MSSFFLNAQTLKINIDKKYKFQTIDGFGASDAWRCQYVGAHWPDEKKQRIAELLFSKELDGDGNPKGIGLSIWRFYIGAGTMEQGGASDIKNDWRRAESFVDYKGNYDWSKQKGQQWFLNEAKKFGVDKFLAFSISAPVHWTKNGKGYNGDNKDGEINLKPEYFDVYSQFMVEVLKHFDSKGLKFAYLSPINEPQWDWEKKTQEGTPATNSNILELTKLLVKDIEESNLETEIVLAEAADLRWLYSSYGKPERGNQIDYFFDAENNVRALNNVKGNISGHSYFTTWPVDSLITIRQKLNKQLSTHNIDYWQSEFCILEKTDDIGSGHKRDLGMDTALYVARVIHADLTLANASSWQWWTALTNANFKDGLIYLDTGDEEDLFNLDKMKSDGVFHDSKLLWALGNYARFVRPNMTRVKIGLQDDDSLIDDDYNGIMFSAYTSQKESELVIVGINYGNEPITLDFKDYNIVSKYVTSKDKDLEFERVVDKKITLEARSVNTLIGNF
ncbi:glycoside hydrolase [Aestuariivivens insulae]|uniref:glycoside hydrolase n=1 Tax=Aestuariivivens insulae TaxID=1621988 RepID=UPI001F58F893|nr:glycoside hydrolase [Aestuariivivens insulae]